MKIYRVSHYYESSDDSPNFKVRSFSTLKKAHDAFLKNVEETKNNFSEELNAEGIITEENMNANYYSLWCDDYNHFERVELEEEEVDTDNVFLVDQEEIESLKKMQSNEKRVTWPGEGK